MTSGAPPRVPPDDGDTLPRDVRQSLPRDVQQSLPRWQELACDAALFGLDETERAELDALEADADMLLDLELAAGDIAARAHEARRAAITSALSSVTPADEAMPAALTEKLFALAAAHGATTDTTADTTATGEQPAAPEKGASEKAARSPALDPALDETPPSEGAGSAKVIPLAAHGRAAEPPRSRTRLQALRDRRREAEGRTSAFPWLLAAAAILLALFGWLRRDTAPVSVTPPVPSASSLPPETPASAREALLAVAGTATAPWKATTDPSSTGATGDVIWHNGVQRGYMRFRGLAPNNPVEAQYQLWIFDGDRDDRYPVDGGVFNVGPNGEVIIPIEAKLHVNKPTLFAITVEKPGGVVVSSRERIVLTASLPPT